MADLQKLYDAVLNGDAKTAVAITREAIAENIDPLQLISGTMVPAMDEVGRRFEDKEYFVPELLISARAMKGASISSARSWPSAGQADGDRGHRHRQGRPARYRQEPGGLAARRRRLRGHRPGRDVPPEKFIEAIREKGAQIVCLSALLTVTMPSMKTTIEALKQAGVRDKVKVLVGGAPVTQQYAEDIGADGYGETASNAVALRGGCSAWDRLQSRSWCAPVTSRWWGGALPFLMD